MRADVLPAEPVAPSTPVAGTARSFVYAALGDSATSGVGDTCAQGRPRGWSRILATGLRQAGHDVDHHVLARDGARARDVVREQLDAALALEPDMVSLLVGGNDVLRGDFDADAIERDIERVVDAFRRRGAVVVLVRLPDLTNVLPMPPALARVIRRRVDAVNVVVDAVASRSGALLIDPADALDCYDRSSWHVDRLHPSTSGHAQLAMLVADRLTLAQVPVGSMVLEPASAVTGRAQLTWLLRNGLPWTMKRGVDLLPTLAMLTVREALARA